MNSFKPLDEASKLAEDTSQSFSSVDISSLKDDIAKLSDSVAQLLKAQAYSATSSVLGAAGSARQTMSDAVDAAQDRASAVSTNVESSIERNPLIAVLLAMVAGVLLGALGSLHSQK